MPTRTFFCLPEEKRQRLMDAAVEEFTRACYDKASINKIIHQAGIPRGSFYQYFEDKEDLFHYILEQIEAYVFHIFVNRLNQTKGDLFAAIPGLYQDMLRIVDQPDSKLGYFIEILRINPELSLHNFLKNILSENFESNLKQIDLRQFRDQSSTFVQDVLLLMSPLIMHACYLTIVEPERKDDHRQSLMAQLEILKYGCLT